MGKLKKISKVVLQVLISLQIKDFLENLSNTIIWQNDSLVLSFCEHSLGTNV